MKNSRNSNRLKLCFGLAAALLLALPAGQSWAQGARAQKISVETLDNRLSSLANRTVEFDAKLLYQVAGEYVNLIGVSTKLYFDSSSELGKQIARDRDETGATLRSKESNLRIRGQIVRSRKRSGYIFVIQSYKKLPDDIPWFEEQLKAVVDSKKASYQSLFAVVQAAKSWAQRYKLAALKEWTAGAERQALDVWWKSVDKSNVAQRLKIAGAYIDRLKDYKSAIEAAQSIYEGMEDKTKKDLVAAKLKEWGGSFHRGRWLYVDDYYKKQGFVRHKDQWVRREAKEFLDFIDSTEANEETLFKTPADTLAIRASQGQFSKYMSSIVLAGVRLKNGALGMPDFVERRTVTVRKKKRVFMQWIYKDTFRFYFRDGELISCYEGPIGTMKKPDNFRR